MQYLAFILVLVVGTLTTKAQEIISTSETNTASITVLIDKTSNNKGTMLFGLHTEKTFMKGKGIKNAARKIKDGKVSVTFTAVPAGEYAILVLHDENDNNRMDFDENGMPKEVYGMSNNDLSFGPPEFSTAKFTVTSKDLEITIRL
jgi:uncharacterized protein (DUF2141 family)